MAYIEWSSENSVSVNSAGVVIEIVGRDIAVKTKTNVDLD